jgi:hypothetical protein
MRRLGIVFFLFLTPVLLALTVGCNNDYRRTYGPEAGGGLSGGGATVRTELNSTGWGTLEGQVVYDGDAPPANPQANITKDEGWCKCQAAKDRHEDLDLIWTGKTTSNGFGVENVVIFLKPPEGKFFKIYDKYKDVSEDPTLAKRKLDQPFCAYEPRVVVLYPSYTISAKKDGKDINQLVSSNQVFEVTNGAKVPHNTKIKGNGLDNGVNDSGILSPGSKTPFQLNPQEEPLDITCDVHGWMKGYAWAFDHPYAVRTDKDGKFKIEHVPAGTEVSVVVWHEGLPRSTQHCLSGDGFAGAQGKKITFEKDKTTTLNLKVKA